MFYRGRRLRANKAIRDMTAETSLSLSDFIYPLFIVEGENIRREIPSMKGVYHLSVDEAVKEVKELLELGIRSIILFGIPSYKDEIGTSGFESNGIIQRAIREIKSKEPEMYIVTDVCLCEYTSHGHCGELVEGDVDNDKTLKLLQKVALSHVEAGADMVAPSDMMDGRVEAIRNILDENGFENIPIMSYSVKYASSFYGPFRDAADSAPSQGDRKTYQMDYRNSDEAIREVEADLNEGADLLIVKPAMSYLDIVRRVKDNFDVTVAVYNVSGEYSMIKSAIEAGLVSEDIIEEILLSFKRAGADIIISYFAKDIAKTGRYNNEL